MTSVEIVKLLQETPQLRGKEIGALSDLSGFVRVAHVIYIVNVRGGSRQEPSGDCACLVITVSGSVRLELSDSLDEFWNYWERRQKFDLSKLGEIADEVAHFFRHQKPKEEVLYSFRDGGGNQRLHRTMRSMQKCTQLEQVFGFQLVASEF